MAEYLIQDTTLTGIADAIRNKTGKTEQIEVQNMSTEIDNIETAIDYTNNSATEIADFAYMALKIKSASFPKVTKIGKVAFHPNDVPTSSVLTSVNFPLATEVGERAFQNCKSLTTVHIPSVTKIERAAFQYSGITDISLPECTSIGDYAFTECYKLVTVDAPKIATNYTVYSAFNNCTSLTDVNMPLIEYIGSGYFRNCCSLKSIDLPSATNIGHGAFSGCTALNNINIPIVDGIDKEAFSNCSSLEHIVLSGFTSGNTNDDNYIDEKAFYNCSNLIAVVLPNLGNKYSSLKVQLGTDAFTGTPIENGTGFIYVPDVLVDSYKTADGWSTYASQIKPLSEYTGTV